MKQRADGMTIVLSASTGQPRRRVVRLKDGLERLALAFEPASEHLRLTLVLAKREPKPDAAIEALVLLLDGVNVALLLKDLA